MLIALLILFNGYEVEWQFPVQKGWVTVGPDVDGDSLPELVIRYGYAHRDSLGFVSGVTRQLFWTVPNPYPGWHNWEVIGAGNMDGDAAKELLVYGFSYSYPSYSLRFRIYDCATQTVEFESPEFTSYEFPYPLLSDLDGDHRAEVIVNYGDTLNSTCLVYGWTGAGISGYELKNQRGTTALPVPASRRVLIPAVRGYPVSIRDAAGRVIRRLTAEQEFLFWDGIDAAGQPVVPGIYFYDNGATQGKIELMQ
ncbi:MAG: hypothetical protein ABIK38_07125 [candidate division WOR-3 bacterium]